MTGTPKPFGHYDRRHYPTLSVVDGYARWAPTYDALDDRLDLDLLAALPALRTLVPGARIVDLGCGTGRTGAWFSARGASELVGVDVCEPMLERARERGVYASTTCASILATGLATGAFDGAVSSMVLDHVADLAGFFVEAHRLLRPGGWLAVVDFHPFFMMQGIPTHFPDANSPTTPQVAIENHVHALRDFFQVAVAKGFAVRAFDERFVTDEWVEAAPNFRKYLGQPVTHAWVYARE